MLYPGLDYLSRGSRSQRYIYALIVHQSGHSCSTQVFFHLAEGGETRPLLSIPRKQISTLYAFTICSGRAGHILHGRLSQSLWTLLSISGEQISMLHSRLYHPFRESRSQTVWTIKPITHTKFIRLL